MTALPYCSGPASSPNSTRSTRSLTTIADAIASLRAGGFAVVADGDEPDCEADLTIAAERITPKAITFMAIHGGGIVYLCLPEDRCRELSLPPMRVGADPARWESALTVSIEARQGVSTGISAFDRARTVRAAIAPDADPQTLVRPGHIFPVAAKPGGVLERAGRTEASVELARLAGFTPAAVDVELLADTGEAARGEDLIAFAEHHRVPCVTVADVVHVLERPASCTRATPHNTPGPNLDHTPGGVLPPPRHRPDNR